MLAIDRACCRDILYYRHWHSGASGWFRVLPSEASGLESRTPVLGATEVKASGLNRPRLARSSCAWSGRVCWFRGAARARLFWGTRTDPDAVRESGGVSEWHCRCCLTSALLYSDSCSYCDAVLPRRAFGQLIRIRSETRCMHHAWSWKGRENDKDLWPRGVKGQHGWKTV
jgi:hypothetical protein